MCGIFGHYCYNSECTRQEILSYLITGLRRLEYRGYDSAGIAVDFDVDAESTQASSLTCAGSVDGLIVPEKRGGIDGGADKTGGSFNGVTAMVQISQPSVLKEKRQQEPRQECNSQRLPSETRARHAVFKTSGKIEALEALVESFTPAEGFARDRTFTSFGHAGIAHTRWATHGPPCATNAHPHTSGANHDFVVVHNGIITNYKELRDFLIKQGYTFVSETDTEVIPKLFKYVYDGFGAESARNDGHVDEDSVGDGKGEKALGATPVAPIAFNVIAAHVLQKLEGAFAVLVKSTHYPGELIACKRGSPLAFGIMPAPASTAAMSPRLNVCHGGLQRSNERFECFIASDVSAFVEHTRKAITLEDDDLLHLCAGTFRIYNIRALTTGADVSHEGGAHGAPGAASASINGARVQAKASGAGGRGARIDVCSFDELEAQRSLTIARRRIETIDVEMASISKGAYEHFMAKEIFEQPETILQTLRGRISLARRDGNGDNGTTGAGNAASADDHKVSLGGLVEHLAAIRRARRILFVGCGTSFNASLACRQTVEELVDVPVALELASDMMDRHCPIARDDVCVFVSQSGETADTLAALRFAKGSGALCVGITNTVGSAIARLTDCGVHINAGCEVGVASTKAYTSQIVAITLMALALSDDFISRRASRDAIIEGLVALPDVVRKALSLDKQMLALADTLKDEHSLLVFGRGYNYATALEGALKVKEVALVHSEGILAGEMKHGPLALVDDKMPILVLATRDRMHGKMLSVLEQLRARGARLIVVRNEGDGDDEAEQLASCVGCATVSDKVDEEPSSSSSADERKREKNVTFATEAPEPVVVRVPFTVEALQPIVNVIPLQLLSYHLAVLRGHDVDQPRNLAKSVTVTEY